MLILVVVVMSLLKAWIQGPIPALLVELFPVRARASGMAIAYNVSVTLFGSLTPLMAQILSDVTGQASAPGYWIALVALLSLVCLLFLRSGRYRAPA